MNVINDVGRREGGRGRGRGERERERGYFVDGWRYGVSLHSGPKIEERNRGKGGERERERQRERDRERSVGRRFYASRRIHRRKVVRNALGGELVKVISSTT